MMPKKSEITAHELNVLTSLRIQHTDLKQRLDLVEASMKEIENLGARPNVEHSYPK